MVMRDNGTFLRDVFDVFLNRRSPVYCRILRQAIAESSDRNPEEKGKGGLGEEYWHVQKVWLSSRRGKGALGH